MIALKEMGKAFVKGYMELVSGEKDPRNLMIIFSNIKVILVEFDIVELTDVSSPARCHDIERLAAYKGEAELMALDSI